MDPPAAAFLFADFRQSFGESICGSFLFADLYPGFDFSEGWFCLLDYSAVRFVRTIRAPPILVHAPRSATPRNVDKNLPQEK
jgi:hypothetical protein